MPTAARPLLTAPEQPTKSAPLDLPAPPKHDRLDPRKRTPVAGFVGIRSLRLLEEKVVELNIVEKASDNTIGRTLKKTSLNPTAIGNG
ncbi:MAG TPA: hypothetical protein VEH77_10660 [Roseiarcus sp.]|nr:hypothetical protein [Roseiarcus sp.]